MKSSVRGVIAVKAYPNPGDRNPRQHIQVLDMRYEWVGERMRIGL